MKLNYRIKIINILALFFLIINFGFSQEVDYSKVKAFTLTGFDEHIEYPLGRLDDSPVHLGGSISYEITKRKNRVYQFTHVFQGGYYYHKQFNQVPFIAYKPKFELRFYKAISLHLLPGVGYAVSFPTQQTYILENGKYVKQRSKSKSHFMPSFGLGVGVHLDRLLDVPIELFARYEMFSLAPYTKGGIVPVTLNTMFSFGMTYTLNELL